MWKPNDIGLATWTQGDRVLTIDARGGSHGIGVGAGNGSNVSICAVESDQLPSAGEQYLRGEEWHVNYPQGGSSYALRLAFAVIDSSDTRLVLEVCVSIQTDLLDLHPKLDVEVDCQDIDSLVPSNQFGGAAVMGAGTAPISIAKGKTGSTSVLLGPHDHPFTTNHSTDMLLRLRLFGDFLEKGVIRKARPWLVFDFDKRGDDATLEKDWHRLCESPLPLTP